MSIERIRRVSLRLARIAQIRDPGWNIRMRPLCGACPCHREQRHSARVRLEKAMPAKTSLTSPIRSLKTFFGTMSKKRRATILATVAVLAVGGIVAGGLSVQSAAVAAEAAQAA